MLIKPHVLLRTVVSIAGALAMACSSDGGPADPALVLSDSSLTLTEGGTAGVVQVSLDQAPSSPFTLTVMPGGAGVEVTPDTLIFTSDNFDVPRPVTIFPMNDLDLVTSIDSVGLELADGTAALWLRVTKNDDDVQSVIPDVASLLVNEGSTVQLSLHLAYQPTANDTISVSFAGAGIATSIPARRVFTTANWNVDQIVNVTGTQDIDTSDELTMLRLSGFNGQDVLELELTVLDDD